MTQTEEQNVPALRFSEFSGEWENSMLSKHVVALDAGVSVNSGDRPAGNGELGILKTSAVTKGVFESYESKVVFESREIKRLKEPVQADTIIVSRMNTPALVGANAYIAEDHINLFLPDRLWAAKPAPESSSKFISYILGSAKGRAALSRRATGTSGSMKNITKPDVLALRISTPTLPEQQKIAAFLSSVDRKIAQLGQKKALLQRYKKGMMQKLFSQELRFKDAQGHVFPDWEEKRLGELGDFCGGGTPDTKVSEYWKGDVPWISSSDIVDGSVEKIKITRKITSRAIKESATKIVPSNSLLIVSRVGVGKLAITERALCTSQDFCNFTPKKDNMLYLAFWMIENKRKLLSLCQGTSIKGLTTKELQALKVDLPSLPEQQKIADFLSSIDRKIDLVADELDHAKTFKKGLLQQMFI